MPLQARKTNSKMFFYVLSTEVKKMATKFNGNFNTTSDVKVERDWLSAGFQRRNTRWMRKPTVIYFALGLLISTIGILSASPAWATEWTVCNQTDNDAYIAIVYSLNDARGYISRGWWKIPGCGACKDVYNGNLPVRGVYLRGEGSDGGLWEGTFEFCTLESSGFKTAHANADAETCRARGQELKAYQMYIIRSEHYTTNLRGANNDRGRCPID